MSYETARDFLIESTVFPGQMRLNQRIAHIQDLIAWMTDLEKAKFTESIIDEMRVKEFSKISAELNVWNALG
jgi:hypothetical protein